MSYDLEGRGVRENISNGRFNRRTPNEATSVWTQKNTDIKVSPVCERERERVQVPIAPGTSSVNHAKSLSAQLSLAG